MTHHHWLGAISTVLLIPLAELMFCMGLVMAVEPIDPVREVQRLVDVYTEVIKEAKATGLVLLLNDYPPVVAANNEFERKLRGQSADVTKAVKAEVDKRLWPVLQDYGNYIRQKQAEGKVEVQQRAEKRKQDYNRAGQTEYQKALGFYYQWKFGEAAPFFQQAAEKGHPEAQLILGTLYQYGQGVPKDEKQAQYWTAEAAKQGHHMKDNRDRVVIYSSKEKSEEVKRKMSSPSLPLCVCGKDIPPEECARRFSCRVP